MSDHPETILIAPDTQNLLDSIHHHVPLEIPAMMAFGLLSKEHHRVLCQAVLSGGVTPEQLEIAKDHGDDITALVNRVEGVNPQGIVFHTYCDVLSGRIRREEYKDRGTDLYIYRDETCDLLEAVHFQAGMHDCTRRGFGISSPRHFEALRRAIRHEYVSAEQLDEVCMNGPKITALMADVPGNPQGLVFRTPWDKVAEHEQAPQTPKSKWWQKVCQRDHERER